MCIPRKTEGLILNVFNTTTEINESGTETKHITSKSEYMFDSKKKNVTRIKSWITMCVVVSVKIQTNMCIQKTYIWNPAICSCENEKYVGSIIDNSVITGDEIIKENKKRKTVLTKCNKSLHFISFFYYSP